MTDQENKQSSEAQLTVHFAWSLVGEASVDVRPPATGASNHDDERDRREDGNEPRSATAIELERAKALSEEARKVLSDLNMGRTAYLSVKGC